MNFKHESKEYRIVFRHDRPRDLSAHVGHNLTVGHVDGVDTGTGRLLICCLDCSGPTKGSALALWPLGKKHVRCTHVEIQIKTSLGTWVTVVEGTGKVNVKAGDKFSRAAGREAALTNAVGDYVSQRFKTGAFENKVWITFFSRRPKQKTFMHAMGLL